MTSHDRGQRPAVIEAWAWSTTEPTRLITGTVVELSGCRAVLRLPELSPDARHVAVRLGLPQRGLVVDAHVVARRRPHLVTVVFEPIDPEDQDRLDAYLNG